MAVPLMVATAAVSAIGQISQGNAASASYKAQAAANNYNAQINQQNAARVGQDYNVREDQLRRQQAQFAGRQRAAFAEADVGTGGSVADVENEDSVNSNLDALTLRYEGQSKRVALLNQSNLDTFNGQVDNMNAGAAHTAGYIGAMGSVLGGVGRYTNYKQTGQIGVNYGG